MLKIFTKHSVFRDEFITAIIHYTIVLQKCDVSLHVIVTLENKKYRLDQKGPQGVGRPSLLVVVDVVTKVDQSTLRFTKYINKEDVSLDVSSTFIVEVKFLVFPLSLYPRSLHTQRGTRISKKSQILTEKVFLWASRRDEAGGEGLPETHHHPLERHGNTNVSTGGE